MWWFNENAPTGAGVNTPSLAGGTVWEGFGSVWFSWRRRVTGSGSEVSKDSIPSELCFLFVDQDVCTQLYLLPCLCPAITDTNPLEP